MIFARANTRFIIDTIATNRADDQLYFDLNGIQKLLITSNGIYLCGSVFIDNSGNITCVSLTQTSKEDMKKNFEKI